MNQITTDERICAELAVLELGAEALVANPYAFSRLSVPVELATILKSPEPERALDAVPEPQQTTWKAALRRAGILVSTGADNELRSTLRWRLGLFRGSLPSFPTEIPPSSVVLDSSLRLSSHIAEVPIDDLNVFVAHPFTGATACLSTRAWQCLRTLNAANPRSTEVVDELAQLLGTRAAHRFLSFAANRDLLFGSDDQERARIAEANAGLSASASDGVGYTAANPWHEHAIPSVDLGSLRPPSPLFEYDLDPEDRKLKICLVGNCRVHLLLRSLEVAAFRSGYVTTFATLVAAFLGTWLGPDKPPFEAESLEGADLVVISRSILDLFLGMRCDSAFDDAHWEERVGFMKQTLTMLVSWLAKHSPNRLTVLPGAYVPTTMLHGRAGYRRRWDLVRVVQSDINQHLQELTAQHANLLYMDVDRLMATEGLLANESFVPFRHEGHIDESTRPHPSRMSVWDDIPVGAMPQLGRGYHVVAQEIVDCYVMWKACKPIKLIVVGVDNTLWAGAAGKSVPTSSLLGDFGWGMLGGLHEALNIVRQRGIPLAVCSKNEESLAHWNKLLEAVGRAPILTPDEFIVRKISSRRTSEVILELCAQMGLAPSSVLFIDDSRIEREEVLAAVPGIRVLGSDLSAARAQLLNDPHLQSNIY